VSDDKVAILDVSTGLSRTFADYHRLAGGLAGTLRHYMHLTENNCVAVYSPNHVDYLPVSLAVSLTGAKMTPINPLFTVRELCTVLGRSKSSVLIAHWSKLDVALQAVKQAESVEHVIVITDNGEPIPEGTVDINSLLDHDKVFHDTLHAVHRTTHMHPFLLPYSSGTTGLPKAVTLTHENIVANLLQMEAIEGQAFEAHHKVISPLPFFHIYAFTVSMLYPAWKGQTIITNSGRFDLELFCKTVQEHKPERSHLVPPILLGLAKHPVVDKYDLSSLKAILSAAAPASVEIEKAVEKRIGCIVKQGWGMSELSPLGTLSSDYNVKPGSVGPLVASTHGKVVDEEGKSLGPNQQGELLIKGPQVMMGYWNEPDKTAECLSLTSGWLRTGDVVYYDEDGFFYVVDRVKELIKVSGYPVAPAELEALLLTHDAVADVAVIQIPHDQKGEVPRAYIVLKDTDQARETTDAAIYDWVQDRVAPYKRLDGGVVFTDTIPKSASGKILRRLLRDAVKAEMAKQ
jgi:4-coumarate--CoA ligase